MIADALKKSLLQAAIQGKLTEQLPEDGDARDLLKEIQKEKARLVKEGKIKREKPLPEIKEDEIPFDIPDNWVWCRLEDCNEMMTGNSIPKDVKAKKYSVRGNGLPYIGTKDVSDNYEIDYENGVYIPLNEPGFKKANKNSTLMCIEGGSAGRKIAMTDREVCFGNKLCKFKAKKINPKYVFYYLQTNEFVKLFKGEMTGIIGGVGIDRLKNIPICLPPLAEQIRIVDKLESVLPEIGALKAEENKLNDLEKAFPGKIRASILQAAIQGKLTEQLPEDGDARDLLKEIQKEKARLVKEGKIKREKPLPEIKEDEIPFDIPDNWVWCRLEDCNEMMTGNSIPKDVKAKKYSVRGNGLPYIGTKDVSDNYEIDYENGVYIPLNEPGFKKANKNSTLMCIEGGSAGRKIAMTDREVCFGNKLCKFKAKKINPKYVFYYLQTNEFVKLFKGEMTGIIGGVGIDRLKNIPICLPPLAEQERIIQELDELLPLCTSLETTTY